jgi:hypothetical protein
MKRSNDTNQGKVDKSAARGQTLRTPIGKDSSDWSGKASDEVTAKMKMGGGMNDLSRTIPAKG